MRCQKLPEDEWLGARQLLLQVRRMRSTQPGTPLFIPAHAGITIVLHSRSNLDWAHPRTYGDNMKVSSFVVFFSGSSPHIRGKRDIG